MCIYINYIPPELRAEGCRSGTGKRARPLQREYSKSQWHNKGVAREHKGKYPESTTEAGGALGEHEGG